MKRIILFLLFLIPVVVFSQGIDTTKELPKQNVRGYAYKNAAFDTSIMFPKDTIPLKYTWRGIGFKEQLPYFWNGSKWNAFTTSLNGMRFGYPGEDTIVNEHRHITIPSDGRVGGRFGSILISNRNNIGDSSSFFFSPWPTTLPLFSTEDGSFIYMNKSYHELWGDTLNMQYGGNITMSTDNTYDSVSTIFTTGVKNIALANAGLYALRMFAPPKASVQVLAGIDGQTGSPVQTYFNIGQNWGYNFNIFNPNQPNFPLSGIHSTIDLQRVRTHNNRIITGNGIFAYEANFKSYQAAISAATRKEGSYVSRIGGYYFHGSTDWNRGTGGIIPDSIYKVSVLDSVPAFWANTIRTPNGEVLNGYPFVSIGAEDFSYIAGYLRIGDTLPVRALDHTTEPVFNRAARFPKARFEVYGSTLLNDSLRTPNMLETTDTSGKYVVLIDDVDGLQKKFRAGNIGSSGGGGTGGLDDVLAENQNLTDNRSSNLDGFTWAMSNTNSLFSLGVDAISMQSTTITRQAQIDVNNGEARIMMLGEGGDGDSLRIIQRYVVNAQLDTASWYIPVISKHQIGGISSGATVYSYWPVSSSGANIYNTSAELEGNRQVLNTGLYSLTFMDNDDESILQLRAGGGSGLFILGNHVSNNLIRNNDGYMYISHEDSIAFFSGLGQYSFTNIPHSLTSSGKMLVWDSSTRKLSARAIPTGGDGNGIYSGNGILPSSGTHIYGDLKDFTSDSLNSFDFVSRTSGVLAAARIRALGTTGGATSGVSLSHLTSDGSDSSRVLVNAAGIDIRPPTTSVRVTIRNLPYGGNDTSTNKLLGRDNTGNLSWTNHPTAISGNSGTATVLQTARLIQGVSFNGSSNIDIINGTGFVKATGTTISYDNSTYLTTASAASTYQPLDGDLTTIAGLTATTDNFIVSVSSAWASRTVAQVKTTLSVNNVDNTSDATKNSATASLTNKRYVPRGGSTTSSATPTINTDNVDFYKLTAQTVDITSFTTNLTGTMNDGEYLTIEITGTATRAIAWGASFASTTVPLPTTTNGTNTLTVVFRYSTTSSYGNNKLLCVTSY